MLLPFAAKEKTINKVVEIEVNRIYPNPYQPRKSFGDDVNELAESIKHNGLLQPITVKNNSSGDYTLIAGERRLRAIKLLGMPTAPCIIIDITDRNSAAMALVENIQRKDLQFFDEAEALLNLIDFYGMTQEDAAIKLGKNQSTIANKLRLLKLDAEVRKKICEYGLTERHARALLKLESKEQQLDLIESIHIKKLNVESTERMIENMQLKEQEKESIRKRSGAFRDVRLFVNTLNKAVEMMKAAGINADAQKIQEENYIEYIVRIPTKK